MNLDEENPLDLGNEKSKKEVKRKEHVSEAVTVNLKGLRDALFDELNLMRAGKVSVSRARVTSQLARRIIETVTLDMCAQNLLGDNSSKEVKRLMSNNVQS